jgi:septal ring factor EnvC (AmiA/AmiB activator)
MKRTGWRPLMLRKKVISVLVFATMFCLSGCQELNICTQTDIDRKNGQIAALEMQLQSARENADELKSRLSDLQDASEDLQANVDRLKSENWRDVVPDIESSSQAVESAQDEASSASEELTSILNE